MVNESKSYGWAVVLIILIILLLGFLGLMSWQVPYVIKESYIEKEPYEVWEGYYEIISAKNCDYTGGCYCIHYSWGGLGACDSCKCWKERPITKYRDVTKQRDITKYCSALNKLLGNC